MFILIVIIFNILQLLNKKKTKKLYAYKEVYFFVYINI